MVAKEGPGYGTYLMNFWRQSAQALRQNGALSETTFHSKMAFFYYSQTGKRHIIGFCGMPYRSDRGLYALLALVIVVGGALEGGELVHDQGVRGPIVDRSNQPIFSLFHV